MVWEVIDVEDLKLLITCLAFILLSNTKVASTCSFVCTINLEDLSSLVDNVAIVEMPVSEPVASISIDVNVG